MFHNRRPQGLGVSLLISSVMAAVMGDELTGLGLDNRSIGFRNRPPRTCFTGDPETPTPGPTKYDLERLEEARLRRERKAAKKKS